MEPESRPALVVQGGPDEDKIIPLSGTVSLGRLPSSGVVVDEDGISRQHAEIVETEDGFELRDLASTNGTFVNFQKLEEGPHRLEDGDRIRLGASEVAFIFRLSTATAAEPTPEAAAPAEPAPPTPTQTVQLPDPVAAEAVAEPAPPVPPTREAAPVSGIQAAAKSPAAPVAEPQEPRLKGVLLRLRSWIELRLRRGPKEPETAAPEEKEEGYIRDSLSAPVRVTRAIRNLLTELRLMVRRRTLTINIESGAVRAVMFEGSEVVAWGVADPEEVGQVGPAGQVTGASTPSLLRELNARRSRLVTALPLYIPLVRHLRLPPIARRYVRQVVMSEFEGTIPFTLTEVDVKWHLSKAKRGEDSHVMAIAVQKEVVDAHVQGLKEAGKGPQTTYSQAAALAVATGVPDAMLVHLGVRQAAVVLVREGVPRVVHRLMTPEGDQSPRELAEALGRAVEQMEGYDLTLETDAVSQRLPVVLTGEVPGDGTLERELELVLQRDVLPLSPPVERPEGFPSAEYATNIGLAVLGRAKPAIWRRGFNHQPATLNLLSERHLPAPIPFVPILTFLALGLLAVGAFYLTGQVSDLKDSVAEKESELKLAESALRIYNRNLKPINQAQKDTTEARTLTLEMKSRLAALGEEFDTLGTWFEMIETITEKTLPDGVKVSDLTPLQGDKFRLAARAPDLEHAIRYVANIRESGLFTNVDLLQVTAATSLRLREDPGPEPSGTASGEEGEAAPAVGGAEISFVIVATAVPSTEDERDKTQE